MAAAAAHAVVPKFGSWDAENIGYTVFFEKVRDNKAPPAAPPAAAAPKPSAGNGGYDFDPYEHYESLSRKVPSRPPSSHGQHQPAAGAAAAARAPPTTAGAGYDYDPYDHYDSLSGRNNVPSRPPSSHGHAHGGGGGGYDFDPYEHYENLSARNAPSSRPPSSHGHGHSHAPPHRPHHGHAGYHHRRTGSNGSTAAASEASSRGSRFSPPRPYQPRYSSNNSNNSDSSYPPPQPHGGAVQYHHRGAPRAASASPSPPRHQHPPPLRRPKASAVPRFGVWDEQNAAAMAAQGFTVQFDKVKRHREEAARTAPAAHTHAPAVQQVQVPKVVSYDDGHAHDAAAAQRVVRRRHGKRKAEQRSFVSRMYRCLFPRVRE